MNILNSLCCKLIMASFLCVYEIKADDKFEYPVISISIALPLSDVYYPSQIVAIAKLKNGSSMDVTPDVVWVSGDKKIAKFDNFKNGLIHPISLGVTSISARFQNIESNILTLTVIPSMVCGHNVGYNISKNKNGGINNSNKENAKGNCVKIIETYDSKTNTFRWFTSSPSINFLSYLGYEMINSNLNVGDSYADYLVENNIYGPHNGKFARFRQDGKYATHKFVKGALLYGVNGQFDRWCNKLRSIKFAGKDNWRRPTENELVGLYNFNNKNKIGLFDLYGWPTSDTYWTSDINKLYFSNVYLIFGLVGSYAENNKFYASCVSEHQK